MTVFWLNLVIYPIIVLMGTRCIMFDALAKSHATCLQTFPLLRSDEFHALREVVGSMQGAPDQLEVGEFQCWQAMCTHCPGCL